MRSLPQTWQPVPLAALRLELAGFQDWVLCGGHAVALLAGSDTRAHGDTDIGVFRSQLIACLAALGRDRVFLCRDGGHLAWDGMQVAHAIHDIWITSRDGQHWVLQVMVFDDEGDWVIYRRDRRIRWHKRHHSVSISGFRVLNPFVTFLFKANKAVMVEKEVHDLIKLIETASGA
jgi:hypothetical protein